MSMKAVKVLTTFHGSSTVLPPSPLPVSLWGDEADRGTKAMSKWYKKLIMSLETPINPMFWIGESG